MLFLTLFSWCILDMKHRLTYTFFFFRAENLPTDELKDVYLLDFVGPSGFVNEISSKVERFFLNLVVFFPLLCDSSLTDFVAFQVFFNYLISLSFWLTM